MVHRVNIYNLMVASSELETVPQQQMINMFTCDLKQLRPIQHHAIYIVGERAEVVKLVRANYRDATRMTIKITQNIWTCN